MHHRILTSGLALLMVCWCGCHTANQGGTAVRKEVTLPGGQVIQCEVLIKREDLMTGMMHRTSLPEDRGLLFYHGRPAKVPYWMRHVRVPLDILWMDKDRKIVEIHTDTPPCTETDPVRCPTYGGKVESVFVLEIAGGLVRKHGIQVGQTLSF